MNVFFILALFFQQYLQFQVQTCNGAVVSGNCVIQPAVTKSDMPPTVSVKMSPEESKRLEHAQRAVADAADALEKAKSAESDIRYDIIKSHRGDNMPAAECQWGGAWGGAVFSSSFLGAPEPKGYLGSINGNWVVFTKGFLECHGG